MKNNNSGSALIISLFITMIISIIGIFLLDKIVPLAKNVKGIENSNMAYYNANTGVEDALFGMSSSSPSLEPNGTGGTVISGYSYQTKAKVSSIPLSLEGNSEYDKNYNKIGIGDPVQLVINSSSPIDWSNVKFNFRVPDLNGNLISDETLSGALSGTGMINWILSGSGKSVFASGEANMIKGSEIPIADWNISNKNGVDLNGSGVIFSQFYNNSTYGLGNCNTTEKCTLKLSVINPLFLINGQIAPYLEYKISFSSGTLIPNQYTKIVSDGFSFGFKRAIKRNVEQVTSNEAMDFTVFQ